MARTASQALHAFPPVPHSDAVNEVTHVEPLQQPVAQLAALQPAHTWAVHVWPPHEAHAAPFFPQTVFEEPAWHTPEASQQPEGQLVASQMHPPPEQRCPGWQAVPVPQAHAPAVQRSDLVSQAEQAAAGAPQAATVCPAVPRQVAPLQQPVGQDAAVQAQLAPEQTWPLPQAADAPHLQTPATQVLVLPEQGAHAAPPVPHAPLPCDAVVTHAPALQQPAGQLVASQTHAPPEHRSPARQAAPAPHLQAPPPQLSAVTPHEEHAAPAAPHLAAVAGLMQAPALQHPPAQLVELQTQAPPTQARPGPQAAFAPHLQAPPTQVSAEVALQAVQATPPAPHAAAELVWQTPFRQHPEAQLEGPQPLQALLAHVWGEGQLWHAPPAFPHAPVAVPGWHWLPAQHPVGQLAPLQTQTPPTHC